MPARRHPWILWILGWCGNKAPTQGLLASYCKDVHSKICYFNVSEAEVAKEEFPTKKGIIEILHLNSVSMNTLFILFPS